MPAICIRDSNIFEGNNKILHFAPEPEIAKRIGKVNSDYITVDIAEGRVDRVRLYGNDKKIMALMLEGFLMMKRYE